MWVKKYFKFDSHIHTLLILLVSAVIVALVHWSLIAPPQRLNFSPETHVEELTPDMLFFEAGGVVVFYDKNYPLDPGPPTDKLVNMVGFVTNNFDILALIKDPIFGLKVRKYSLRDLDNFQNVSSHTTPLHDIGHQVASYFEKYQNDPFAFFAGKAALFYGNRDPFIRGTLIPEYPQYKSEVEREAAWITFISKLHTGDRIVTYNHSNIISHIIAWSTHGPWSHLAVYLGDGQISEFVTSGLREASIEIYKAKNYSVAAYRYIDHLDRIPTREEVLSTSCCGALPSGAKYDYIDAIVAGWHAANGDFDIGPVPNSVMYLGTAVLVAQY
jgi:hypothetical protein